MLLEGSVVSRHTVTWRERGFLGWLDPHSSVSTAAINTDQDNHRRGVYLGSWFPGVKNPWWQSKWRGRKSWAWVLIHRQEAGRANSKWPFEASQSAPRDTPPPTKTHHIPGEQVFKCTSLLGPFSVQPPLPPSLTRSCLLEHELQHWLALLYLCSVWYKIWLQRPGWPRTQHPPNCLCGVVVWFSENSKNKPPQDWLSVSWCWLLLSLSALTKHRAAETTQWERKWQADNQESKTFRQTDRELIPPRTYPEEGQGPCSSLDEDCSSIHSQASRIQIQTPRRLGDSVIFFLECQSSQCLVPSDRSRLQVHVRAERSKVSEQFPPRFMAGNRIRLAIRVFFHDLLLICSFLLNPQLSNKSYY